MKECFKYTAQHQTLTLINLIFRSLAHDLWPISAFLSFYVFETCISIHRSQMFIVSTISPVKLSAKNKTKHIKQHAIFKKEEEKKKENFNRELSGCSACPTEETL